jgi:hypothetical protein
VAVFVLEARWLFGDIELANYGVERERQCSCAGMVSGLHGSGKRFEDLRAAMNDFADRQLVFDTMMFNQQIEKPPRCMVVRRPGSACVRDSTLATECLSMLNGNEINCGVHCPIQFGTDAI